MTHATCILARVRAFLATAGRKPFTVDQLRRALITESAVSVGGVRAALGKLHQEGLVAAVGVKPSREKVLRRPEKLWARTDERIRPQ